MTSSVSGITGNFQAAPLTAGATKPPIEPSGGSPALSSPSLNGTEAAGGDGQQSFRASPLSSSTAEALIGLSPKDLDSDRPPTSETPRVRVTAIPGMSGAQIAALSPSRIRTMSSSQIASLGATEVSALSPAQLAALWSAQIGAIGATNASGFEQAQSGASGNQQTISTTTEAVEPKGDVLIQDIRSATPNGDKNAT